MPDDSSSDNSESVLASFVSLSNGLDSDSTFILDGGDVEADTICSLYDEPLNSSVPCKFVHGDGTNDAIVCDDEDDNNVDEVYSDFR